MSGFSAVRFNVNDAAVNVNDRTTLRVTEIAILWFVLVLNCYGFTIGQLISLWANLCIYATHTFDVYIKCLLFSNNFNNP